MNDARIMKAKELIVLVRIDKVYVNQINVPVP